MPNETTLTVQVKTLSKDLRLAFMQSDIAVLSSSQLLNSLNIYGLTYSTSSTHKGNSCAMIFPADPFLPKSSTLSNSPKPMKSILQFAIIRRPPLFLTYMLNIVLSMLVYGILKSLLLRLCDCHKSCHTFPVFPLNSTKQNTCCYFTLLNK